MFRLIKLAIYGVLGYAIYEFVRGLTHVVEAEAPASARRGQRHGGAQEADRGSRSQAGRMNMTGPAQGERITTAQPSGESVSHVVGRGVVSK